MVAQGRIPPGQTWPTSHRSIARDHQQGDSFKIGGGIRSVSGVVDIPVLSKADKMSGMPRNDVSRFTTFAVESEDNR